MDNQDIVREFEKVGERIDALSEQVSDIAKGQAVIASQLAAMAESRKEMRAELAPITAWVAAQMTGGLTQRMATVEKQAEETKAETRAEFQVLRSDIRAIQDQIKYWSGAAAALLFVWGIFGDRIKGAILGALGRS